MNLGTAAKSKAILLGLVCLLATVGGCKKDGDDNKGKDEPKPVACISVYTATPVTYFETRFSASCSENATAYLWEFGDGNTANEIAVDHIYTQAGTYTVTLKVTNAKGSSSSESKTVTVGENPLSKFTGIYYDQDETVCENGNWGGTNIDFEVVIGPRNSGSNWGNYYGYHLDFLNVNDGSLMRRVSVDESTLNSEYGIRFSDLSYTTPFYTVNGSFTFSGDTVKWQSFRSFADNDPFSQDDPPHTCEGISVRQ